MTEMLGRAKAAYADLAHRARWHRRPQARVTRRYVSEQGLTVKAGPFAGMAYPASAVARADMLVPKLLGSYECELHAAVERLVSLDPERIVDVGAADGYYAVGLARRIARAEVCAFEMNPFHAGLCAALARENGVENRVTVRGECRLEDIARLQDRPTAFFMDCEGCERELLDPERVPLLRRSAVIVELHEFAAPGVGALLRERFSSSHDVETISARQRFPGEFAVLETLPRTHYIDRELAVNEFRPVAMSWLLMLPGSA